LTNTGPAGHRSKQIPVAGNTTETLPANAAQYPALDGMRAVAFLAVFAFHYLGLPWGWGGVNLFFVLSGFLITGILFDTQDDRYRARNFYLRRGLRIFPLYYGTILLIVAIYPIFRWKWSWGWLIWPAYVGNLARFIHTFAVGSPFDSMTQAALFSGRFPHVALWCLSFWTLCVEEQFYLIWPWFVFFIRDRRTLIWVCAAAVATVPVLRALAPHYLPQYMSDAHVIRFATPFQVDSLLLGGLVALLRRGSHRRGLLISARIVLGVLSAAGLMWFVLVPAAHHGRVEYVYPSWEQTWGVSYINLVSACLIIQSLEFGSTTYRLLTPLPLRSLGRIAYGCYIFHEPLHPVFLLLRPHFLQHTTLVIAGIAFVCTVGISWASFRWFESPFIRLKARWTR
jgi:peptidoglycan/LPS O-acetylase OafA/YrhL